MLNTEKSSGYLSSLNTYVPSNRIQVELGVVMVGKDLREGKVSKEEKDLELKVV